MHVSHPCTAKPDGPRALLAKSTCVCLSPKQQYLFRSVTRHKHKRTFCSRAAEAENPPLAVWGVKAAIVAVGNGAKATQRTAWALESAQPVAFQQTLKVCSCPSGSSVSAHDSEGVKCVNGRRRLRLFTI